MEKIGMNTNAVTAGLPPRSNRTAEEDAHEIEQPIENPAVANGGHDLIDDKKLKRILARRQHARTYLQKKKEHKAKLEGEVKSFQAQLEITDARMKYLDSEKSLLEAENASLKQKLSAFMGELGSKQAQYADLKQARENMKLLQQQIQQNNQNMNFPFYLNN